MWKLASALILVLSTAVGAMAQSGDSDVKAIVGANVVDIDGGEPIRDAVVVIENDRISAMGPSGSTRVPAGAEVIRRRRHVAHSRPHEHARPLRPEAAREDEGGIGQ